MTDVNVISPSSLTESTELLENDEVLIIQGGVAKRLPKAEVLANRVVDWDLSVVSSEDAVHEREEIPSGLGITGVYGSIDANTFDGGGASAPFYAYAGLGSPLPATGKVYAILGATYTTTSDNAVAMYVGAVTGPAFSARLIGSTNTIGSASGSTTYLSDWDGTSSVVVEMDIDSEEVYLNYINTSAAVTRLQAATNVAMEGLKVTGLIAWESAPNPSAGEGAILTTDTSVLTGGLTVTSGYTAIQKLGDPELPTEAADGDLLKATASGIYNGVQYSEGTHFLVGDVNNDVLIPIIYGTAGRTTYIGDTTFRVPTDYGNVNAAIEAAKVSEVINGRIAILIESGHVCTADDAFLLQNTDLSYVDIATEDAIVDWDLTGTSNTAGIWSIYAGSTFGSITGHYRLVSGGSGCGLFTFTDSRFAGIGTGTDLELVQEGFDISPTYRNLTTFFIYAKDIGTSGSFATNVGDNNYFGGRVITDGNVRLYSNGESVLMENSAARKLKIRGQAGGTVYVAGGSTVGIEFEEVGAAMSDAVGSDSAAVALRREGGTTGSIIFDGIVDRTHGGNKVVSLYSDWEISSNINVLVESVPPSATLRVMATNPPTGGEGNLIRLVGTMGALSVALFDTDVGMTDKPLNLAGLGSGEADLNGSVVVHAGHAVQGPLVRLDDVGVSSTGLPAQGDSLVSAIKKLRARLEERVAGYVGNADPTDLSTVAVSVDAIRDALVAAGLMNNS